VLGALLGDEGMKKMMEEFTKQLVGANGAADPNSPQMKNLAEVLKNSAPKQK
jgi:hypothetical protein